MMDVVVFVGPTLSVSDAQAVLPARYLPPAATGDVYRVACSKPAAIALIDGTYQSSPTVWHKEILYALSRGIRVFGSASMGALRAAELVPYGMEGHGRIFEAFRDGALTDDDEVAVAHAAAEHAFRPLSEALVNVRYGLEQAVHQGLVSATTAAALIGAAKGMFYPERSWAAILATGDHLDALAEFVRTTRPNLKRTDALAMLTAIAADPLEPHVPSFSFPSTAYFRRLQRATRRG